MFDKVISEEEVGKVTGILDIIIGSSDKKLICLGLRNVDSSNKIQQWGKCIP